MSRAAEIIRDLARMVEDDLTRYGAWDQRWLDDYAEAIKAMRDKANEIDLSLEPPTVDRVVRDGDTYRVLADLHEQESGHICTFGCDSPYPVNCNCGGRCPTHAIGVRRRGERRTGETK